MTGNVEIIAQLISTAQASYADFLANSLADGLKSNAGSFTETEAQKFIDQYDFIHQQLDTGTGFSAAVFQDKQTGKLVFAVRGTQANTFGDISSDIIDIGIAGFANKQAVDMYRYWKKLTTTGGEAVVYSNEEIFNLYYLNVGSLNDDLGALAHAEAVAAFKAKLDADKGLLSNRIPSYMKMDITGHSLGGNLAYVFSKMFPQNSSQVVTINAPGISGGDTFLADLGFTGVVKTISVNAEADPVHRLAGTQPGQIVAIGQEVSANLIAGNIYNHSVVNGVDSLNLSALFAKLDPTQAENPSALLKTIMQNSSYQGLDTYENMLDSLRKLLIGGDFIKTPAATKDDVAKREQFYLNMKELEESGHFVNLKGHVKFFAPSLNAAQAKSDYGQFLALYFGAPFALQGDEGILSNLHWELYSEWSADQNLSAADRQNGKANFSDEWYQDRTNYLSLLLERNAKDIDFNESANPNGKDAFYVNVEGFSNGTGRIFSGGVNAGNINQEPEPSRIIFGTQADNNPANSGADGFVGGDGNDRIYGLGGDDKLNGLKGNDELYGGTGDDELTGGEGHDVLLGGEGTDTYTFEGNFGTDVIKDSDGIGSINIAGWSGSFTSVQGSDIIFRDVSQKFEAIKINNGTTTDLLITSLTDESTGNVLIKNWNPGNLGISLTVDTSTPSNGSAGTVNGDGGNNAITLDNLRDSNPNLDISTFSALSADGGGGNDIIMGMLQGNDTLLGGAGDDIISGGFTTTLGPNATSTFQSGAGSSGVDSIDGGAGNDFIFAAAGGSVAHGGSDNDILVSTGPAYFLFNNLKELLADESRGIPGHRALTRDEIYADALSYMNFGVEKNGLNYTRNNSYFKDFTSSYAEYNSAIENVKFIGKSGSTSSNHSNGDVSYGFAGSYTLTYDYSNTGVLTPLSTNNPSPLSMAVSTFAPGAGRTLEDFANVKGANLFGDAGDDYLEGGIYADYLSGGADNDVVFAGAGNDIIDGGDGNDELYGEEGRDIIIGGKGDDTLAGGDGNDLLVGGEGRDGFVGGDGDDILVGGVEDRYMSGGAGNNIYIFEDVVYEEADLRAAASNANANSLGYASLSSQASAPAASSPAPLLTIESTEGNNTLALVGVSSLDQISLTAQENDLILRTGNAAIFIRDGLNGAVDHLAFGNNADEFKDSTTSAKSTTIDDVMLARLSTEVTRTAQTAGSRLAGGLLNDTLTAHVGGSVLIGGQSDDTLIGNEGDDIYVISEGDGFDSITEHGGINTIKLAGGINVDQLALHRSNGNLLLIISGTQSVVVNGMFDASNGDLVASKAIHKIEFSNGEIWDLTRVLQESAKGINLTGGIHDDFLIGYESSDTITGGQGNDKLRGDKGDDHYHFGIGDGADQIDDNRGSDHIYFAEGISEAQVSLRKDTNNNLIIRINNNDSITVLDAFNNAGELTAKAIEHIHFDNTSVWDLARIQSELAKDQSHIFTGTTGNDQLVGDNASQTFNGNQGDDQLHGGNASDVYQYALGDGKDVIKDVSGNDRLELLAGINESEVVARRDGDDLVLTMKDGGSITIQNTFGVKAANVVDPVIATLIEQLQSHWMSQAETLIEQHYGLTGSGDITLGFEDGLEGAEAAHVEGGTVLKLVIDLSDFSNPPNGVFPHYYDRIIAHEMVHAVMMRNMNLLHLPGWFTEGTAEFIHGADERVKGDANIIGLESNFNQLFKTTEGSPSTSAGYSVSYIAVKLLDKEIRNHGGIGIREVFDQLKAGKTLDQSLIAVSAAHTGLETVWSSLSTFEAHFRAVGFAQYTQLLKLDNLDTGSIAGSDYGNISLNASAVISDAISGPSHNFNLIVPDQYISTPEIDGVLESIGFSLGGEWDFTRITQEVLKPTNGDDVIHAFDTDDALSGSKGNDQLFGYAGNDVYRYETSDGNDVIVDSAGIDQIEFGVGILAADIKLRRDLENNLVITLKDNSTITVKAAFDASGNFSAGAVESIKFLSGGVWDGEKIREEVNRIDAFIIKGNSDNEALIGTDANDIFIGAQGDDYLQGKKGDDRYVYNLGDGNDRIIDEDGIDEIVFGDGIVPAEVLLYREGSKGLKVVLKDGGSISIDNMFNSSGEIGFNSIEGVRFSDSDFWDISQIKHQLIRNSSTESSDNIKGFSSNDVIEGGGGFDQLDGKEGDDRYIFRRGDGVDVINDSAGNDTLGFAEGIAPEDVLVYQNNGSTYFIINNGEMVQVTGGLIDGTPDETRFIERVEFSGGVVWDKTIIQEKIAETQANPNFYFGRDGWDHLEPIDNGDLLLNGLGGNDQIYGGNGNDTLIGGGGLNFLDGENGDDTYLITEQPSTNFIENFRGDLDRILYAEGITPEDVTVRLVHGRQEKYLEQGVLWVYTFSQSNDWNLELTTKNTTIYVDSLFASGSQTGAKIIDTHVASGTVEFFDGTRWTIDDLLAQAEKGTSANDRIVGSGYAKKIEGLHGNDSIFGLSGDDTIDGGDGDDYLIGGRGKDILIGGKGNDQLFGDSTDRTSYIFGFESVDDIYRFNVGDGSDTIADFFGLDTIEFGEGIAKEQITLTTVGNDILVSLNNSLDGITILNGALPEEVFFNGGKIELFKFANGDEWNFDPRNTSVLKEGDEDDDTLTGGYGNDTFIGHSGNDRLRGDLGDDSYHYNLGDGHDHITDIGGFDQIILGNAITPEMVNVRNAWDQALTISINGVDALSFNAGVYQTNPDLWLEKVVFSSGNEVWDQATIYSKALQSTSGNDEIHGSFNSELVDGGAGNDIIETKAGNDTLIGGIGNDYLRGGAGDDVYRFSLGDGSDSVSDASGQDTIEFLEGILPADISVQRTETDLILRVKNANPITLSRFFNTDSHRAVNESTAIENIIFANGDSWSRAQLLARLSTVGTSSANNLYGSDASELIDAKEGNDSLFAGGGNDTLIGGSGNDTLYGEAGDDLLQGGDDDDWLRDQYGSNIYVGGRGSDVISLPDFYIDKLAELSTIRFGLGDGSDRIERYGHHGHQNSSPVIIELGVGITPDMLAFKSYFVDKSGGSWDSSDESRIDLLVTGTSDRINNLLNNGTSYTLKFSDDTVWTAAQLNDAAKKSMATLSENRKFLTGNARPNSKIYISYLNQNNSVTEHPVIQTDASGFYEFDFGFGIKDISRIIIFSKDSNGNTLPITVFGPAIDTSTPPSPTVELDSSGYVITGFARPGTYVYASAPDRYIGNEVQSDLITGEFTIVSSTRLNNGERISVVASSGGQNSSEPTVIVAPYMAAVPDVLAPVAPTGDFDSAGKIVSGAAEPDTLVFVEKYIFGSSNYPVIGFTRADLNGAWSIELTESIIDGSAVRIISVDAGNNRSVVSILSPDLTAPLPATAQFDSTGKIITGVAERTESGGNQVIVMDATNSTVLGSAILAPESSSYRITLATALINNEAVNIIVKDVAGNSSGPTRINAPDKTNPAAPSATIDQTRKVISGEAEAGATVQVKNTSGAVLGSIVADTVTGAYSITLGIALAVNQRVNVTAKDLAGNISPIKSVIATGVTDTTPPEIPTASFDPTGRIVSGNAEAGSVVVVKNANNTSTLGTFTAHATTGAYSITLVTALINLETVNVTATDAAGNESVARAAVAPGGTAPNSSPLVIQAENYTSMRGVQKENTSDVGGGQNAGYIDAGDWMAYNNTAFNVPAEGRYLVTYRVASLNGGGRITLKELSTDATLGSITVPKTSGWQNWVDVTQEITLNGGVHNFKLAADIGGFNINWFKLEPLAPIAPDTTPPAPPTAEFDPQGKVITGFAEAGSVVTVKNANNTSTLETVTAHATTGAYSITLVTALINKETVNVTATDAAGNASTPLSLTAPDVAIPTAEPIVVQAENYSAMSGVRNEATSDIGGGQNTGSINTGDWMAYNNANFNVPAEGLYKVTYRVASLNGGGRLALKDLSTNATLGAVNIPKTGAWQSWIDVTQEISLSEGIYNFKLQGEVGGFNVNWFKLEPSEPIASATTQLTKSTEMIDLQDQVITGIAEAGNAVVVNDANNTGTLGTITADATKDVYEPTIVGAEVIRLKTDYESVQYVSSNDALIQAMASFVSESGVDTRYRSTHAEQSPFMIAVGS